MKTFKIYGSFLLIITTAAAYSQEPVMASAQIQNNAPETTLTTAAEADVEEKKEAEPTFTFSGSVDTYFHSGFGYKTAAPATSFANNKGFGLGMANLIASYTAGKAGFTADLVFGPRGKDAVFNSSQGVINQMYTYYKLTDKITLNLGQFNTFLGYEVISPTANFNYSTSYMFSYGPFNHTGLRADITLGNGVSARLAVMNPTDIVEFNPVNTYTIGGQIGKSNEAGSIWFNVLYGDQDGRLDNGDDPYLYDEAGAITGFISSAGSLLQADITTSWNLTNKFFLGLNTSYQMVSAGEAFVSEGIIEDADGDATGFFGVALYPKVTLSESFALGLRAEYFSIMKNHLNIITTDEKGNGSVTALTLSGNYKSGALTIIPEFRVDKTSKDSFVDRSNSARDVLSTFRLAAVYKF